MSRPTSRQAQPAVRVRNHWHRPRVQETLFAGAPVALRASFSAILERENLQDLRNKRIKPLRTGILAPGTRLVLDERQVSGPSPISLTDRKLRCSVGSAPRARENVVWEEDEKSYSLSGLTMKLRDECGVPLTGGALNGNLFWCLESSPGKSLWDLAEENGRS